MKDIFEKEYTIEYYDVDKENKASFVAIVEYMLESASMHSEVCDFGREYLGSKGQGWILLESRSKFFKLPKLGEKIIVKTWAKSPKNIFIFRQYEILNEKGETLCVGTSKWIVYSLKNRMPERINDDMKNRYTYSERNVIDDEFVKIKDEEKYTDIVQKEVLYRDVDTNWHMNNIKYLRHIVESMSNEFLNEHEIDEYSIKYKHQLIYPEKFDVCINKINDSEYMYYIKQKDGNIKGNNSEVYVKWKEK